jgi:hypothetical protein
MYSESASSKGQSIKRRLSIAASTETVCMYIYIYIYIYVCVSKPMSQTFPGYSPPPIKPKSSYEHGSKSEQVPRYPLLCRNLRNAVINKKYATMSNA